MADFDPDAYIASKSSDTGFDPDAYIKAKDPNAYDTDKDYEPDNRWDRLKAKAKAAYRELAEPSKDGISNPVDKVVQGGAENVANFVSGMAGTVAGGVAGLGSAVGNTAAGMAQGKPLSEAFQEGAKSGAETLQKVSSAMTYQPKTAPGKLISELSKDASDLAKEFGGTVGSMIFNSGSAAMPVAGPNAVPLDQQRQAQYQYALAHPSKMEAFGRGLGEQVPNIASLLIGKAAKVPVAGKDYMPLRELTSEQLNNVKKQSELGVKPTLGSVTRNPVQMRYEDQTASKPGGEDLAQRQGDNNQVLIKAIEDTDKLRKGKGNVTNELETGKSIAGALEEKSNASMQNVNDLYEKARAAGETKAPVNRKAFMKWFADNRWRAASTPAIKSLESRFKGLVSENKGKLTIDDAEELYKAANQLREGENAGPLMRQFKQFINTQTDGAGGDLYRAARQARNAHGLEFEDRDAIARILEKKSGSRTDYRTPSEQIYQKSVVSGSLDEMKDVMQSLLNTEPKKNPKAWQAVRDTQKQMIDTILDSAVNKTTGNLAVDNFRKAITTKFGKAGVQKLRYMLGDDVFKKLANIANINRDMKTMPRRVSGSDTSVNEALSRQLATDAAKHLVSGGLLGQWAKSLANVLQGQTEVRLAKERMTDALTPRKAPEEDIKKTAKAAKKANVSAKMKKPEVMAVTATGTEDKDDPLGILKGETSENQ